MTNNRQQAADGRTEQIARRDLYEGVRQLNHATAGPPGLTYPGTVYTVLGQPRLAVYGLEQGLGQLHRASSARNSTPGRPRARSGAQPRLRCPPGAGTISPLGR